MRKLSIISRDEPENSLEKAIWWTEYVLRHKGAKHLRSAALDLEWYQYVLLDVVGFLLLLIFTFCFTLYYIIKIIWHYFTVLLKLKFKTD